MLTPCGQRGLTLIELMTVMLVIAVFSVLMLPSFQTQIHRARRSDALQAITQVQQSQERWRVSQPGYAASLTELGVAAHSPAGHYALSTEIDATTQTSRYIVSAAASGAQAADDLCRHLRLVIDGGQWQESSGPDTAYSNDAANNRRCWNH